MIGLDGEDNMEVKNRKLSSITAYGKNAKKHDKTQINNVAESIKQYGFVQPIVIDRDGVIVIGHCRAMAAKKLGMEEVPCVCVDDLTPEQVNALRLVDNKSNESNWDFDLLADELPGLDLSAFDFDWGLRDELDTSVVEDNYDPVLPAEPKSKLGDVYQLGDHRLMCGDSTSLTDVQKLVGGRKWICCSPTLRTMWIIRASPGRLRTTIRCSVPASRERMCLTCLLVLAQRSWQQSRMADTLSAWSTIRSMLMSLLTVGRSLRGRKRCC